VGQFSGENLLFASVSGILQGRLCITKHLQQSDIAIAIEGTP
jgi:hypothetical protein